jgi:hypothetical protein
MFARNLSDKGDMRPGPAHLVGPHLAGGPARLLPALATSIDARQQPLRMLFRIEKKSAFRKPQEYTTTTTTSILAAAMTAATSSNQMYEDSAAHGLDCPCFTFSGLG